MLTAFAWFVATIVTIPIFGWYLVYIITVKITKNKRRAVRLAIDGSCILFITSVYFIMYELWQRSFLWIILTLIFFIAFIFTFIHWKIADDIYVKKLFRGIWRTNFLIFFFLYFILIGYGLLSRVFAL
ncbi:DUF3397 domain-containing protein [Halalkalibacter urbisdiaboli]|uniref:DUF3397 domain-containing protein n=1 Tax=Halalkalibacter urbisdiaboli TaxID=1960589 RepID=UPI000B43F987|nr:DUF3397 domain-containing protein [Halalkalibacter urbisdiaboli]